jgi:hypothetical protein
METTRRRKLQQAKRTNKSLKSDVGAKSTDPLGCHRSTRIPVFRQATSSFAFLESLLTSSAYSWNLLRRRRPVAIGHVDEWHYLHADILGHHKECLGNV